MELLVVIGIIAILIGILLPTLNKVRKQSRRTACLSNQRQIAMGLIMYANANKGYLPYQSSIDGQRGINATPGLTVFSGLGLLVGANILKDGQVFYCPERAIAGDGQNAYDATKWSQWPKAFQLSKNIKIDFGYLYRQWDEPEDYNRDYIPAPEWQTATGFNNLHGLRLGKLTLNHYELPEVNASNPKLVSMCKIIALTSDLMGTRSTGAPDADWSHPEPWGAVVGYSDGHGEWVQVPKAVALIPRRVYPNSAAQKDIKKYIWTMFRCYDTKDFADMYKRYP